jgi:hypothetical protein
MHVENAEQVHATVPFLKPQRPTPATSRFKGEFGGGGGGVGDGVHAGVKRAGISRGAIQGMAWMERRAGEGGELLCRGVFHSPGGGKGPFILPT